MAPFRPANLNKRAYPGNASVIGPTVQTTVGFTTTSCCSSTNVVGACICQPLDLGCRCSFCGCPCCNVCCSCPCTVCDRTVPSGMWKSSEQWEARTRDAWGDDSCSSGTPVCVCCTDVGYCSISNVTDCKGYFICCGPGSCKWFVAPCITGVSRTWYSRNDAVSVANSCMGSCGWFIGTRQQMITPASRCAVYWDCSSGNGYHWTNTTAYSPYNYSAYVALIGNENVSPTAPRAWAIKVRAIRSTAS